MIAVKRALKLALNIDLSPTVLEGDSKNTIDVLMCEGLLLIDYKHLVDNATRLANRFKSMKFSHIKREDNSAVYNITKHTRYISKLSM